LEETDNSAVSPDDGESSTDGSGLSGATSTMPRPHEHRLTDLFKRFAHAAAVVIVAVLFVLGQNNDQHDDPNAPLAAAPVTLAAFVQDDTHRGDTRTGAPQTLSGQTSAATQLSGEESQHQAPSARPMSKLDSPR